MKINKIVAREVLDSRGNPTVEAEFWMEGNFYGHAICPSGASTGEKEAVEVRGDDKKRYNRKGVLNAVNNVEKNINDAVIRKSLKMSNLFVRQHIYILQKFMTV